MNDRFAPQAAGRSAALNVAPRDHDYSAYSDYRVEVPWRLNHWSVWTRWQLAHRLPGCRRLQLLT